VVLCADAAAPGPATDAWLGRAILGSEHPFHPIGLAYTGAAEDGLDMSIFTTVTPPYAEVLEVRAGRVAMVRDFLAGVTPGELATTRPNPWGESGYPQTTLSCLNVILEEEREHLRYAAHDLEAIEAETAR
jgi:DinB superfamily